MVYRIWLRLGSKHKQPLIDLSISFYIKNLIIKNKNNPNFFYLKKKCEEIVCRFTKQ